MAKIEKSNLPDATETLRQIKEGERSSKEVVGEYLARLEANHERVNGATQIFREEALKQAERPKAGPLSGLPITIKETYGLAGEIITAGSVRMPPVECQTDAVIVQKLKAAGAIVMARSNIPEFAMTGETTNLRFGRTNNGLDPARTAGGSTGGEGALLASGSSPLGFGSDILGSLRIPGVFNGVVGFKPASGAVDKTGTWPVVHGYTDTWLCLGPMARSVRDVRLAYNVIAREPLDEPAAPRGLRLVVPNPFRMKIKDTAIASAYANADEALEEAGMKREEQAFPEVPQFFLNLQQIVTHDFENAMLENLTTAEGGKFSKMGELFRRMTGRGTIDGGLFQMLLTMPVVRTRNKAKIEKIIQDYESAREKYHRVLGSDGILIFPTIGFIAPKHGGMNRASLRPGVNGIMTPLTFCNYMNLPAITIPAWRYPDNKSGMPPGIMLACAPGAEGALLDAAAALEAAIS